MLKLNFFVVILSALSLPESYGQTYNEIVTQAYSSAYIDKGGHVILLVGYDSENKTFIFQNSWGTEWGQDGYGTIPEEYIINYYELAETFPYGTDASEDEKNEAIKGSLGVSASLENL